MSNKIKIMILVSLLLLSGGAAFFYASQKNNTTASSTAQSRKKKNELANSKTATMSNICPTSMNEAEVADLLEDMRTIINEYKIKMKNIGEHEKRTEIAQLQCNKTIAKIEGIQANLSVQLNRLTKAQAQLENSRIRIRQEEKSNLMKTAAIYAKMPVAKCSEIMIEMYSNNGQEDVAKVLMYMPERSAGKVLAEMKDRSVAAKIIGMIKLIREEG